MFGKKEFITKTFSGLHDKYKFDRNIGIGTFGTIHRVLNTETKEYKACKQLSKSKISNMGKFREEINILIQIDHPNVIKLHEVYEDNRNIFLVMEECSGGTLFDKIEQIGKMKKNISEKTVALIFKQIIDAINHCHSQGICHRDLKPENILFLNKEENSPIKVIDFGLGIIFGNQNEIMESVVGSPNYVAPEVLNGEYDKNCDIWSAGIILYNLLSGLQPFDGKNEKEIYESIKIGRLCFPVTNWEKISEDVKDLISNMICPAKIRFTAEEVLNHKWLKYLTSETKKDEIILNLDFQNLKKYIETEKFKKVILTFIATRIKEEEIQHLKDIFIALDLNNDGYLTIEELKIGCSKIKDLELDIEKLFNSIDSDKSGMINYTEFLAATLDKHIYHKEERLYEAFKYFDQDKSGKISVKEIANILNFYDDVDGLQEEIKTFDLNGDGEIDYSEFCSMMGKKIIKKKSLKVEDIFK